MKQTFYIELLVMFLSSIAALGQTPFDAFAPETSRVILDADSIAAWKAQQKADTFYCAIVADLHKEELLLVDIQSREVLAYAPFTEEIKKWMTVDPLADKYISTSPYLYCAGNPIMLIDPDGKWVEVVMNDDDTYTITNGIADNDRNIYITKNGERTNEVLGQMATQYSFFNKKNEVVSGAVINMKDNSGELFLKDFEQNSPSLISYVFGDQSQTGRNNGRYDFKIRGYPYDKDTEYSGNDIYRGMPITVGEQTVIGSARDIGNYAAGYLAGLNGIPYSVARIAFNIYNKSPEPAVSRAAQNIGHNNGYKKYLILAIYINTYTLCR